jgi:DNA topoisomerase-1
VARALVIVESPAKAKTINKFLGKKFVVKASMGHVRDLPKKDLGVDEKDFTPTYDVLPEKKKTVTELKKAAKTADAIYLAPDPDREGEAICWHLKEVLKKSTKADFYRVRFNEITKRAVLEAFDQPMEIDLNKVDAQQARRILDRLVGYKLSPLLWDKVRRGLSAGRVQSVALRIICERERAIQAFEPEEYWSLTARLEGEEPPPFQARLVSWNGKKAELANREQVEKALTDIGWVVKEARPPENGNGNGDAIVLDVQPDPGRSEAPVPFRVASIQAREKKKNPLPPFTTSKLQQDAARQLGFPVAKTMRVAQGLYEGRELGDAGSVGLITYMRTDSTRVSDDAIKAVRSYIGTTFGEKALPAKPRQHRVAKNAQEAHEAIRPTALEYPPDAVKSFLGPDELKLYTLIWNRFVASQMESAVFDTTRADISAGPLTFRATGSVLKSKGWLAVYHESRDEDASRGKDEEETDDSEDRRLPPLKEGQELRLEQLRPKQHFTQPPPRFSEATLVKELEENGIGRPSTYASILSTIRGRDYVEKEKNRFKPTELGFLVNDLMVASFDDIVAVGYTARMEEELDQIEEGALDWTDALKEFQKKFEADLERAKKEMRDVKREAIPTDQTCDKCGKPMVLKWGRFGQFLACSGYPECKNTRDINGANGGTKIEPTAKAAKVAKISTEKDPIEAEADPCDKCGRPMVLKRGRFGPFLACSGYPECKSTRKIKVNKDGTAEAKKDVLLEEDCPKCGAKLALKHGRFGEFTACSSYPKCRYIKMKETGVNCPECGKGKIVERRSKRGKLFYGCDQYPDCEFVLWSKPVDKACPSCERTYLLAKNTKRDGKRLICDAEGCGHAEPVEEEDQPATA